MGHADYYKPGDYNAMCWQCGGKFKASELKKHWQGQYWCARCWEPRHPQDFVRSVPDAVPPPWVQQRPEIQYLPVCTPNGRTAKPGFAKPGCVKPSYVDILFNPAITY